MSAVNELKVRKRDNYPFLLSYRTRWSDNDQYAHVNNSIYFHFFDSVVNTYLIRHCGLKPPTSPLIGLVVSSYCHFFAPASFPVVLDLGLRVVKLGNSSVAYEIGVFEEGKEVPNAVGGYTHVFVDNASRKSTAIDAATRSGLQNLYTSPDIPQSKL
ncbi:hypothetical protein PHLGIDRAFT_66919 [Phlebiopsis gigantea 11061_1 CR5-6]|uniref:Thioesterase domain-containing protein n=1 Tax=Phlebiopsis gigantea (strain 11061_1 CR5-6) TaxID=745531 RepID=A0A0C3NWI1_PHLG1|nr:hypothetical protein PHLGIDRAFT_66919 [Phlebiopsis gigantea 11061_1 CR5-6]